MAWRQHIDFLPVQFVRANTDEDTTSARCSPEERSVDGKEIKAFYEQLVGLNSDEDLKSTHDTRQCSQREHQVLISQAVSKETGKESNSSRVHDLRKVNKYLQAAQNGDIKQVCSMLRDGTDIDVQDQYQWTALMCATQAAQKDIVRLLLHKGANRLLVNSHGRTALDIAKSCHYSTIVKLLETSTSNEEFKNGKLPKPFYCNICKAQFSDTNQDNHSTSTIHLFNMKLKPKRTMYQISEASPGFQMMLRSGWNEEKGLGKWEQGQKFPLKTVLKRDRQGLGCKTEIKAKVTHFGANDVQAVKSVKNPNRERRANTMNRKARLIAERKERQKEIRFRREFYTE